ncbi:MAG TPA: M20/M25/M40 family metallo-hydrolase, partial [Ktedonobacteraceae bacterium]|nr:M20/M25/M40 family metallo-hydrolase [Ktedonobacteraceae bacterium]
QLSFRLVPAQEPREIAQLLRRHIATVTPATVDAKLKITGDSSPVIIARHHLLLTAATRAIYKTWGVPPAFTRSGGTISLVSHLQQRFAIPIILLGFGLPDDDIHAPNEKLNLFNFFRGVETIMQVLKEFQR